MTQFTYGPVELYLVGFEGDRPSPGVVSALTELIDNGSVRLLDFVIVSRSESGEITVAEVEDQIDDYGLGDSGLSATGLVAEEDIAEFAELIPPGASAALVALELSWARTLADRLDASGGVVLRTERIPAPIVNAITDALASEQ
ncbi:DUF6325 domain-containing protein [Occultella aeris]|uniref:DUF1269 domain-containing protein n=1 Tax=Occultella aeris TaxID=2761496 RepID=A0A7M4DIT5_9MICO|nr:DUF6325 family protein [Occultella aeris]VZO36898.1 hypothetical protein HALOF300_02038 [Occultella aeris]